MQFKLLSEAYLKARLRADKRLWVKNHAFCFCRTSLVWLQMTKDRVWDGAPPHRTSRRGGCHKLLPHLPCHSYNGAAKMTQRHLFLVHCLSESTMKHQVWKLHVSEHLPKELPSAWSGGTLPGHCQAHGLNYGSPTCTSHAYKKTQGSTKEMVMYFHLIPGLYFRNTSIAQACSNVIQPKIFSSGSLWNRTWLPWTKEVKCFLLDSSHCSKFIPFSSPFLSFFSNMLHNFDSIIKLGNSQKNNTFKM